MTDALRERLQAALGPQYTLTRELGGGGMSRVFVARDETLGRDVVVKLFSPDVAQELSAERFTREIRLAAALQHAHIVPLLSAGATADGLPFYLMPFVEGEPLRARLAAGEPLPVADVVLVLRDVARALAYAHARGVVHRDIKPDNVMLSGGAAVVTDFGIAKAMSSARLGAPAPGTDASLTRMGTSLGSPAYMAPEQGTGDPDTDHRADVYALGATAYELLTGAPPFGQRSAHALLVAHLSEAPPPLAERRPDVPPALAALVMRCLAKDPADRPQTATELLAALEGLGGSGAHPSAVLGAVGAAGAAGAVGAAGTAPPRSRRRLAVAGAAVALLAAAGLAAALLRRPDPGLDGALLAVMPFNVRDASLGVWREGLVDVLSRSVDGAGALRTAAPSTVIARSPERADAASAAQLGRALGAGLVLFGDLTRTAGDSVHLRAALFDVAAGRVRRDLDLRGEGARMDAMADSLAFAVLRELGATPGAGGSPLHAVGTRSLPALRAFLRGQHYYRRALVDSARLAYQEAVTLDSTFALGWRGVASLYIRAGQENAPEAQQALDRAIRYKSGRSPRDSLVLRADSLRLAIARREPGARDAIDPVPHVPELLATLRAATERYPSDAELWYELGDVGFHFGEFAGVPQAAALAAFERGIAVDSSFVVPYFHAMDLAIRLGRLPVAARYARRIAALVPPQPRPYYELLAATLESPLPFSSETRRLLDSLPARHVAFVMTELAKAPDSAGVALQLARRQLDAPSPRPEAADSTALADAVARALAMRGRLRDAAANHPGPLPPTLLFQLAALGGVPDDSVAERARRWVRGDPMRALPAMRLWADRRDTMPLVELARWADAAASGQPSATEQRAPQSPAATRTLVGAYLALARGDSAAALDAFLRVPMAACSGAPCAGSLVARLLADAGREQEAARVLDRWLPTARSSILTPPASLLRAQLAESLGDDERAIAEYRTVLAFWRGGDPPTQAAVREAEAALRRLTGRPD